MSFKKIMLRLAAIALLLLLAPRITGAADNPSVVVKDQVVQDHYVIIDKVVAAQAGWIVIHATDKGGTVLGYSPVKAGENDKVEVEIDLSKATPSVTAMLHIDAGKAGVYEFPGADTPVAVGGKVINPAFKIIGVDVDDQFVKDTKTVEIASILAQQDGWIVIHAGDKDGTVLGFSPIKAGLNSDVKVTLKDVSKVTDKMTAMIHIDAGKIGTYEFPGADIPPSLGGTISNEPFWTVDHVRVEDQALGDDGTLEVPYVLASADGWIVIHAGDKNGTVLGYTAVKKGLNEGVKVKITDPTKLTDKVSAMLHIDAGTAGTYEFPGPDVPVSVNGEVVNPFFSTKGDSLPSAEATAGATMDMGMHGTPEAAATQATK